MSVACLHVLVSGIVQGVGYRHWATQSARALGLSGWVRNLHDGRVELVLQGPAPVVAEMLGRCQDGPRSAEVTEVAASPRAPAELTGFASRPTADAPLEDGP